eukprot:1195652-Prorocentrum_minimum.AAC.1
MSKKNTGIVIGLARRTHRVRPLRQCHVRDELHIGVVVAVTPAGHLNHHVRLRQPSTITGREISEIGILV